ncbi:MAG TPA: hypothetical protein VGI20_02485 [Rhizomicrobium sp.]|jgi:hypothetical protein
MSAHLRSLAFVLATSAMLLRAMLPAGWMPEANAGTLVICTAQGPLRVSPARHGQHGSPDRGAQACPFAAAAQLARPLAAILAPAPNLNMASTAQGAVVPLVLPALAHRIHSPRAPPVLA